MINTNNEKVTYKYDESNQLVEEVYAKVRAAYTYNSNGLLETVSNNGKLITTYEYNNRGEVVKITQGSVVTVNKFNTMGQLIRQTITNSGTNVTDTTYEYDGNSNLVEEVVNGVANTYKYNKYDELEESKKYIDGQLVETKYEHDIYGNQVESRITGKTTNTQKYTYNDKGQVTSIKTSKGTIRYTYDTNGNVSKKTNENGRIDKYSYNEHDELVVLQQGQYKYEYTYDAEHDRVQSVKSDTKDYGYTRWYEYEEGLVLRSEEEVIDIFDNLREQVEIVEENKGCTITKEGNEDAYYNKKPVTTKYLLDKNVEYTTVLKDKSNEYVYGHNLVRSNEEVVVSGFNGSVVARVVGSKVTKDDYSDFGKNDKIVVGYGYNGEMKDESGLIYLRARYYDPGVGRFVQIDKNYAGEQEVVNTQNRYSYTINNPYKYVDRDGNQSKIPNDFGGGSTGTSGSSTAQRNSDEKKAVRKKLNKLKNAGEINQTEYNKLRDEAYAKIDAGNYNWESAINKYIREKREARAGGGAADIDCPEDPDDKKNVEDRTNKPLSKWRNAIPSVGAPLRSAYEQDKSRIKTYGYTTTMWVEESNRQSPKAAIATANWSKDFSKALGGLSEGVLKSEDALRAGVKAIVEDLEYEANLSIIKYFGKVLSLSGLIPVHEATEKFLEALSWLKKGAGYLEKGYGKLVESSVGEATLYRDEYHWRRKLTITDPSKSGNNRDVIVYKDDTVQYHPRIQTLLGKPDSKGNVNFTTKIDFQESLPLGVHTTVVRANFSLDDMEEQVWKYLFYKRTWIGDKTKNREADSYFKYNKAKYYKISI